MKDIIRERVQEGKWLGDEADMEGGNLREKEEKKLSHSKPDGQLYDQTNSQMHGQSDGQMHGQSNGQSSGQSNGQSHSQMHGQSNGQSNGQSHSQMHGQSSDQPHSHPDSQPHSRSYGQPHGQSYRQLLERAMKQSAIDLNCCPEDFLCGENRVVYSAPHPQARRYLTLPFDCNLVSYGRNIVASVKPETEEAVRAYIGQYSVEHCFETPNLHVLDDAVRSMGLRSCFMAEYFLPDPKYLVQQPCEYEIRLMGPEDFTDLYTPQWSNALSETRRELDVLGTGVFDRGRLIGLAACSADCEDMWQIGVDVLPEYRRHGIAAALTSRLAAEILKLGKVPFYCAAWSNIGSVRNAIASGFRPAWVEMTVKPAEFVDGLNHAEDKIVMGK